MSLHACAAILLAAVLAPTAAAADPIDGAQMTSSMRRYFDGEKEEGWVFGGAGLLSLGAGSYLLTRDDGMSQGAAIPNLAVGLVETIFGVVLLVRTEGQIADRRARIAAEPAAWRTEELARIDRVNTTFRILFWSEMVLAVGGTGSAIAAAFAHEPTWEGVSIGIAVQAAVLLVLDLFAAARATRYTGALRDFEPSAPPVAPPEVARR